MKLLLLLLSLGLTLVCAHAEGNHDVVTSNFDMSKISGEWYTILLSSDRMEKIEEKGNFRLFTKYIELLQNSSLLFKVDKKINGRCTNTFITCDETGKNGIYRVVYDGYNTLHIIEAVYSDYTIIFILNYKNEKETQVMGLLARKPDVSPQLKERFEKLSQDYGIPKENVLDLTKVDRCFQARGDQGGQTSSAK